MDKFRIMKKKACFLGVLSGLAYATKTPTWLVRIAFALIIFLSGPLSLVPYLLLGFFVPAWKELPPDYEKVCE